MISKDKEYRTRDGREVRIYATDAGGSYPVHGAVNDDGMWNQYSWAGDGRWSLEHGNPDEADLIEVKPRIKRTVWLNVWPGSTEACKSKETADRIAFGSATKRLALVKVEIDCEEGEGL